MTIRLTHGIIVLGGRWFAMALLSGVASVFTGCQRGNESAGNQPPAASPNNQAQTRNEGQSSDSTSHTPSHSDGGKADGAVFRFESMLKQSGIDFVQTSGNSKDKPFPAANGTGAGAIDVDADGRTDLYFSNGATFPLNPDAPGPWDRLYRNLGEWTFRDITSVAGIGKPGYSCGVAVGDFDNDGFSDVYVTRYGANLFYRNLGDGTFEECATSCGVADEHWGTSVTFLDYNEDGYSDLYVCNYGKWTWETSQFCGDPERGIRMFCSPTHVQPEDDILFANNGDGTFRDASKEAGIRVSPRRGQGVIAGDFDGDSHVDIYVANDIHPNFLFLNRGGKLVESAEASGTALDHLGQAQAGMGLAAADVNADGRVDLFVTNYQNEHNALYLNLNGDTFLESGLSKIPEGSIPWVGWGAAFADMDLDGQPDLIVTNGHTDDNLAQLGREGDYEQPPGIWRNEGGQFVLAKAAGPYFSSLHVGRGLVSGDFDNDGDTDFVVCHQDAAPELLNNVTVGAPRPKSRTLMLRGTRSSRQICGATLLVGEESAARAIPVTNGGSYASAPEEKVVLSEAMSPDLSIRLRWCNTSQLESFALQSGHSYMIIESPQEGQASRFLTLPE